MALCMADANINHAVCRFMLRVEGVVCAAAVARNLAIDRQTVTDSLAQLHHLGVARPADVDGCCWTVNERRARRFANKNRGIEPDGGRCVAPDRHILK